MVAQYYPLAKDKRVQWTPDQDSLLLLHYGTLTLEDLAAKVGKSPSAVRSRMARLRRGQANTQVIPFPAVATTTRRPHNIHSLLDRDLYPETAAWGVFDDFRVRLFYGDLPLPELSARLGRTVNAVRARVNHLGWSLDKAIAFRLEVSRSPLWIEALQAMQAMEDNRGDK
jgi:hypothetical protein